MKKCIVTGGGGFVGKALCKELLALGFEVHSIARGDYPELRRLGVKTHQGDLSEKGDWTKVFADTEAVFHTASKVDMWGELDDFYKVNVIGTRNVIEACTKHNVSILVYTSSPSVIADGTDARGIDESKPYPVNHAAHYPATKAQAEKLVLMQKDLKVVSLRPHLIWGPGDTHLVPMILQRAKAGKLTQIGKGTNVVDVCFIDDCVQAHICAYNKLSSNNWQKASGRAYFISQDEPIKMWDWMNRIVTRSGLPPIKRKIPFKLAYSLATVSEYIAKIFGKKPALTRFLVSQMATSHFFNIDAAKNILGYRPKYSISQALDITFGERSENF